jgi:hypothetical protein
MDGVHEIFHAHISWKDMTVLAHNTFGHRPLINDRRFSNCWLDSTKEIPGKAQEEEV